MPLTNYEQKLFERTGFGTIEKVYSVPLPDMINFYDAEFNEKKIITDLSIKEQKKTTPYFICKYFNKFRFDENGNRINDENEGRDEDKPESDEIIEKKWSQVCQVVRDNQKFSCSDKLNKDFFTQERLNNIDLVLLLYVFSGNTSAILNGFAICEDLNIIPDGETAGENSLYIDAICSNPRIPRLDIEKEPSRNVSFGREIINHLKEYGKKKQYYGITLSSLMYVINYYRKLGFRHVLNLNGEIQNEDEDIQTMGDKLANKKFYTDAEMEDYMYIELADKLYPDDETKMKQQIKQYWINRGLLEKDDDEIVDAIYKNYIESPKEEILPFINKLVEKGFSSSRIDNNGNRIVVERKSMRQAMDTKKEGSNWSEGFKMSYSFANNNEQ